MEKDSSIICNTKFVKISYSSTRTRILSKKFCLIFLYLFTCPLTARPCIDLAVGGLRELHEYKALQEMEKQSDVSKAFLI